MTRKINFAPDTYHHIYSRGTEKREIFLDKADYYRFLMLLYLCNGKTMVDMQKLNREGLTFTDIMHIDKGHTLVDIGVYCLMPNHIHLLIKSKEEKQTSKFLQKLFTAYTMYFNKNYKRTGRLFESTAKSILVEKDKYLEYLFAYIHLNPIKIVDPQWKENGIKNTDEIKAFLDEYLWSSYGAYTNKNFKNSIINKKAFPEYFSTSKSFNHFIDSWLTLKEEY